MNKNRWALLLIIILAFTLRFWKLSSFPALNADEAALGYNAWSLLATGVDEHGNSWPIHLQSFNDYKPALYMYLILPFVKIMGLNILSVRIVGAAVGVLTVATLYFLGNELDVKNRLNVWGLRFGIFASFVLAISPWHIHFSRGGWEVNVATFFITLGVYFMIRAIRKPSYLNFQFLVFIFVISLYTYHAARVIVPLLGLGFLIFFWRELFARWKMILPSILFGILLIVPLGLDMIGPAGLSRVSGVGIFSDPGPINRINEQRGEHGDVDGISAKVFHNKAVNYSLSFLENWGDHYSGDFLFINGDVIQRNKVPDHGQMYIYDILFVIIGLFAVFGLKRRGYFMLWWLVVAPVAAALTFQSPHALRAQNMIIPLSIISAAGLVLLLKWLSKDINSKVFRFAGYFIISFAIVFSFVRYQQLYWIQMPVAYPYSSQYGAEQLYDYINQEYDNFDKIIITDRYDQPYILALFYLKYSPSDFQSDHVLTERDEYGFSTVRNFGKFEFRTIDRNDIQKGSQILVVGTEEEIPNDVRPNIEILFPNGEVAYKVVKL